MKIGMFYDGPFPTHPRIKNEAVSLIRAGHDVSLFALEFGNRSLYEDIEGIKVFRYYIPRKIFKKLYALAFTIPLYKIVFKKKIRQFIQHNNIEAIHIHNIVIASPVMSVNKKFNLPVILDIHENKPVIMKYYPGIRSLLGKLLVNLNKWEKKQQEFVKKTDFVAVVTEEAKNDLLKYKNKQSEKIIILPNTIVIDQFIKKPLDQNIINRYSSYYVILYLGDTGLRRGVDTAIKAISNLKHNIPNVKLVVVGKSRDDKYYKSLVGKLGLKMYVDFEGWQQDTLFPSYIAASSVCISPLRRNKHHDTTYANKIFQYMALGKPQVVSDSTAQAELIKKLNCGLIHKAEDDKDLAKSILKLYQDQEKAEEMGLRGRKAIIEHLNWKECIKPLTEIYSSLKTS
ncbi:glycosyltransferase family 4 protein [Candidatus Cloacimonadota bacterium]